MWPFDSLKRKRILRDALLADALWQQTRANHPILARLQPDELARLRELTTLFMHEKLFEPVRGLALDDAMRAMIAVQACLPILHLGLDWYDDWRTVVVYPGQFVRRRELFDNSGVMHEWREVLGGESWERGPVILSWADVDASGLGEGYNVVIHEMAHKLDMRNGDADGFPPLHRTMKPRAWTDAFTFAYQDLSRRVDGHDFAPIDAYATESPAEFFAVVSEYFFELPQLLADTYPEVYRQLAAFYRQDPLKSSA
jgi:Mlc titration factor MtfA (ptsG expression regulator)